MRDHRTDRDPNEVVDITHTVQELARAAGSLPNAMQISRSTIERRRATTKAQRKARRANRVRR